MMVREWDALFNELVGPNSKQVWNIIDPNYVITDNKETVEKRAYSLAGNVNFVYHLRAAPRAWVTYNYVNGRGPPRTDRRSEWQSWIRATLTTSNDLIHTPVIHRDHASSGIVSDTIAASADDSPGEIVPATCVDRGPNCVVVSVTLDRPGLLVLRDSYYPGWRATVLSNQQSNPSEIWRVNAVERGVLLPAGAHQVVFRYQPRILQLAAITSAVGWLLLVVVLVALSGIVGWLRAAFFSQPKLGGPGNRRVEMERTA